MGVTSHRSARRHNVTSHRSARRHERRCERVCPPVNSVLRTPDGVVETSQAKRYAKIAQPAVTLLVTYCKSTVREWPVSRREWRGLPPGLRDQTPRVRPVLLTPDGYCKVCNFGTTVQYCRVRCPFLGTLCVVPSSVTVVDATNQQDHRRPLRPTDLLCSSYSTATRWHAES